MELLLSKGNEGNILIGTDQQLLSRAATGDDLTIYVESKGLDEYLIFGNYVITRDRVSGLGLPHPANAELFHRNAPDRQPGTVIQHVCDSKTNMVLAKDFLDEHKTLITVLTGNPSHRSYTWYSTRRYVRKSKKDLKDFGDQFKILLTFSRDFRIVVKPDIVYFPHQVREYLVKSSVMLLPSEFALDPNKYIQGGQPLTENQNYSSAFLNIGSDDLVTIVHKQRFTANEALYSNKPEGTVTRTAEGPTMVTNIKCDHTILVPEE